MAQYGRPSSDITNNTWSTLPTGGQALFEQVNETPYSDTDYDRANGVQTMEVKLSSVNDPSSSSGHILRLRAKATGASGAEKWTVTLYQGATLIATAFSNTTVTRSAFNAYSYTLTVAQANAITNYADLRVRIVTSASSGEYIDVSWIELEVPDVPVPVNFTANDLVAGTPVLGVSTFGIIFIGELCNIDHETGDLSQYTSIFDSVGDLSASIDAKLAGSNYGLKVILDDTTVIYGEYALISASVSGKIRIRFYIDPASMSKTLEDLWYVIRLYNSNGDAFAGVGFGIMGGNYVLQCVVTDDTGDNYFSGWNITDQEHYVELYITRETADGANNGSADVWLDGADQQSLTNLDNFAFFSDFKTLQVGAISSLAGVNVTYYIDEIVINNSGDLIGPLVQDYYSFTANNILSGTPILGAPTIGQKHIFTAANIIGGTSVLGSPNVGQKQIFTAINIIGGIPVLGSPSITQKYLFTSNNILTGTPALSTPIIGQKHIFTSTSILAETPILDPSSVGQKHIFTAVNIIGGTSVLNSPSVGQKHIFTATNIIGGTSILGKPSFSINIPGEINFIASNILGGTPIIGTSVLGQKYIFTSLNIICGSPIIGAPTIGQKYAFNSTNIITGSPILGNSALSINPPGVINLTATDIIAGSSILGKPSIGQVYKLTSLNIVTGNPNIGVSIIRQKHIFAANNIVSGNPINGTSSITLVYEFESAEIITGFPIFNAPAIQQIHKLTTISIITGSPNCYQSTIGQLYSLISQNISLGVSVLEKPTFRVGIIVPDSVSIEETQSWDVIISESMRWTLTVSELMIWTLIIFEIISSGD